MGKTRDALKILARREGKDEELRQEIRQARMDNAVARAIRDAREAAGLTQVELAGKIGTTQSVISRLEDDEYEGHSLSMLDRIARALGKEVAVEFPPSPEVVDDSRYAFHVLMREMRRVKKLTIPTLADQLNVDPIELLAIERDPGYKPTPRTLHQLATFYKLPVRPLLEMAGAIEAKSTRLREEASRFAAQSESFENLTKEEKRMIDRFVSFLRKEAA